MWPERDATRLVSSDCSLPILGSDSRVRLVYVGRDREFMHRGVSLARAKVFCIDTVVVEQ
jgi:hypothetical protein